MLFFNLIYFFITRTGLAAFAQEYLSQSCIRDFSSFQKELISSSNVFFVLPSEETTLSDTEKCALISAIKLNPQRQVSIFSNHLVCEDINSLDPSIQVIRYDLRDVFQGYLHFEKWFESGVWDADLRGLSLSIRIALLHRFGGVYIDKNTVSLRSLDDLINYVGLENPSFISPNVLAFERGHSFLALAEHVFVEKFRANESSWNERIFTQIWIQEGGALMKPKITLAPVKYSVAVSRKNVNDFYQEYDVMVKTSRFVTFSDTLEYDQRSFFRSFCDKIVKNQLLLDSIQDSKSTGIVVGSLLNPISLNSFFGEWTTAQCNNSQFGEVFQINEIGMKLSKWSSWTLSVWIFLESPDFTSRESSHYTPDEKKWIGEKSLCMPQCNMRIPTSTIIQSNLAKTLSGNNFNGGDMLFLTIENGHVAFGDQRSEWKRSVSSIADQKWHHIGMVFDNDASQLMLIVDGLLQAKFDFVSTTWLSTAWLQALVIGGKGNAFIHSLNFYSRGLTHSELLYLRNTQNDQTCAPFLPKINSPRARILLLILSDTRQESAAIRKAVRNSWLQLFPFHTLQHVFCVGIGDVHSGKGDSMIDIEQEHYSDLLIVDIADGYKFLSKKVHECLKMVNKKFGGTFDFVIKTDHDVFLRVDILEPELTEILSRHSNSADPLLHWRGFVYHSMPPMRDLTDKNADFSQSQFLTYPPFTAGVAYELSAAIVSELVKISNPIFFLNEDQSLGVWMEQRIVNGGNHIEPIHDIRFQQSAVCFPSQVTHHFMADPVTFHRQLFLNIRNGVAACSAFLFSACCLCCECDSSSIKWFEWFECNSHGAYLYTLTPLSTAIEQFQKNNPISESWELDPLSSTKDAFDRIVLEHKSCSWDRGSWTALGFAAIFRAKIPRSVTLRCLPQSYSMYYSSIHFCAGSVTFLPIVEDFLECPLGLEKSSILRSHGHRENNWEFGYYNPSYDHKTMPSSDTTWILVSGWVTTERACLMTGLEELSPRDVDYTGPPNFGTFASLCGLVIDIKHADGASTMLISAFARNASRYFHAELLRVFHPSPLIEAIATVIIPPSNHTTWVTISDLSLRKLEFSDDRGPLVARAYETSQTLYTKATDPRRQRFEMLQRSGFPLVRVIWAFSFFIFLAVVTAARELIPRFVYGLLSLIRRTYRLAYLPRKSRGE